MSFEKFFGIISTLFLSDKITGKDAGILATLGMMLDNFFASLIIK